MKKVIVFGIFTGTAGVCLGWYIHSQIVHDRLVKVTPLLGKAMTEAIDKSFEPGATRGYVMDSLKSDLKFIEQVMV